MANTRTTSGTARERIPTALPRERAHLQYVTLSVQLSRKKFVG